MLILNRILSIFLRHLFLNEQQYPFHIFLEINIERLAGTVLVWWRLREQFWGTGSQPRVQLKQYADWDRPGVPSGHC